MSVLFERLGVEVPIVQAGMGGGIAGHELAAAVSGAGALGTIGMASPRRIAEEIKAARELTDRPIAVNLLLPFAHGGHWKAAAGADVVTTFWGRPERHGAACWIHQVGSVEEAQAAHAAGADAVIVQGVEAGGHVRGIVPAQELLAQVKAALPSGFPLLLAGGIADVADVRRALDAGAAGAVLGTRFLMSQESGAAAGYKARLRLGSDTVLTELFGVGWPGAHRVLTNGATSRWLGSDRLGPPLVRRINRLLAPAMTRMPSAAVQAWMVRTQRVGLPFFTPTPPGRGVQDNVLDVSPLYAGVSVARIDDLPPAVEIVQMIRAGLSA